MHEIQSLISTFALFFILEVTRLLSFLAQASHELVPPEVCCMYNLILRHSFTDV